VQALVRVVEHVSRRGALWAAAAQAVAIAMLAASLPPDAWFVGDPGIKLIAARNAIEHPARPLESALPPVAPADVDRLRQPFFVPHGDHAHAITSPLFPLLSAPFIAGFGLAGAYVLPAIGWLLIPPLTVALSRRLGTRASPLALWIAMASATPFVFYGLEFWEHAPAVACLLAASCLAIDRRAPEGAGTSGLVASGAVGGVAILLRPEAIWAVAAIAAVAAMSGRARARAVALIALGAGMALTPLFAYNLLHFGALSAPHVAGNLAGLSEGWWTDRLDIAGIWLGIHREWTRVAFALIAGGAIAGRAGIRTAWPAALAAIGVVGFAFEIARGHEIRESLWRACPLVLLALLPAGGGSPARRALWLLGLAPLAGALLTAPNDGGGQWGPRYALAAVPPLVILALDTARALPAVVGRRAAWVLVAWVLASSLAATHDAYEALAGAKRFFAGIVADTAAALSRRPGQDVLTDIWWLPQVGAAVLDPRRTLWVAGPDDGAAWLTARPQRDVLLVIEREAGVPVTDWTAGACHRPVEDIRAESGLRYVHLSCSGR
jgi:hypothetical protein